jgi:hypothetical protein
MLVAVIVAGIANGKHYQLIRRQHDKAPRKKNNQVW